MDDETISNAESTEQKLDQKLHDLFGPILEKHNINEVIIVARDPNTQNLALYYKGHFYDIAKMVAITYRKFKSQIERDLI